jgi:SAM-dependent methyltransferase
MSLNFDKLSELLVCPKCHNRFLQTSHGMTCCNCKLDYEPNENGYLDFVTDEALRSNVAADKVVYVKMQESDGPRVWNEYLKPLLSREPFRRVLNVGCGVGAEIPTLWRNGYEAYGIDLPYASNHWERLGYDSNHLFCSDATCLPFATGFFDVVYSFGVIEHIGTKIGHCTLLNNYKEIRQQFADELLRVTKWGGAYLLIARTSTFL